MSTIGFGIAFLLFGLVATVKMFKKFDSNGKIKGAVHKGIVGKIVKHLK